MTWSKPLGTLAGVLVVIGGALGAAPAVHPASPLHSTTTMAAPVVQVALLLDTSSSMNGLIDQARSQLWKVVNEFATARRAGRPANLEVALYEYGNNGLEAAGGYLRQVLPFSTDLDRVSEELFALTTNGGEEYCGTVIQAATRGLKWSTAPDALKVLFIAGNEPFTQGQVDYRVATKEAISKGVIVNTIHCGPFETGVASGWRDGALLADGSYSHIDQNRKVAHIAAPQDAEIARLGVELNNTYVPYGAEGRAGQVRQAAQDKNAASAGAGIATQRALSKASRLYSNATWDLVDAVQQGKLQADKLEAAQLPEDMRALSPEKWRAYLDKKAQERKRLQTRVGKLNQQRKQYVAQQRRTQGPDEIATLDVALIKNLKKQARRKNIIFE